MYRLKSDVEIHIPGLPPIVASNVNEYGAMILKDYPQFADRIEEVPEKVDESTVTEFPPPEDPLDHPEKKKKKKVSSPRKKSKK